MATQSAAAAAVPAVVLAPMVALVVAVVASAVVASDVEMSLVAVPLQAASMVAAAQASCGVQTRLPVDDATKQRCQTRSRVEQALAARRQYRTASRTPLRRHPGTRAEQ